MYSPTISPALIASTKELRKHLWTLGYRPLAVYNHDLPKCDWAKYPGKQPSDFAWQSKARETPPHGAIAPLNLNAMNTGLLGDGLRAVDLDVDDPQLITLLEYAASEVLGPALVRHRCNTPRTLLLYRAAEGQPKKMSIRNADAGHLIEVLGYGQQFVAYGVHPSGVQLQWCDDRGPHTVPRDGLTAVTEDDTLLFLETAAELIGAPPPKAAQIVPIRSESSRGISVSKRAPNVRSAPLHGQPLTEVEDFPTELLSDVIDAIPNTPVSWDEWIRIGLAIHAATGGTGYDLFNSFSQRGGSIYNASVTERQWRSFQPNSVNIGTLIYLAKEHGWQDPRYKPTPSPKHIQPQTVEEFLACLREA